MVENAALALKNSLNKLQIPVCLRENCLFQLNPTYRTLLNITSRLIDRATAA
jgi:hypothetical protein